MKFRVAGALSIVLVTVLSGCANQKFVVKPVLVAEFEPIAVPSATETFVYVIRGSQFQGGGRSIEVAVNDKAHAKLGNGTHTFIRMDSGVNTVSLLQSGNAFMFKRVDHRPGEIVFLYMDYGIGTLNEARGELGKTMIQETRYRASYPEPEETDVTNGITLNPGWLELEFMKQSASLAPDSDHGVVTIARPGIEFKEAVVDVWSGTDGLVGSLTGESAVQVKLPAGRHRFFSFVNSLYSVEIDVSAGEFRYVELTVERGFSRAIVSMTIPSDQSMAESWVENLELRSIDSERKMAPEVAERISRGFEKLKSLEGY